LLDAALEHFARRPYDEVVASEITESAGVANGLLFHYFASKRGIYLEALAKAVHDLNSACAVDTLAPVGAQIRQLLTQHLTYLAENENLALNVILNRSGPTDALEAFEASRRGMLAWIVDKIGLRDEPDTQLILRSFGAAVDEATIRWLRSADPYPTAVLVEAIVELLIGALRAAAKLDPSLEVDRAIRHLRRGRPSALDRA